MGKSRLLKKEREILHFILSSVMIYMKPINQPFENHSSFENKKADSKPNNSPFGK